MDRSSRPVPPNSTKPKLVILIFFFPIAIFKFSFLKPFWTKNVQRKSLFIQSSAIEGKILVTPLIRSVYIIRLLHFNGAVENLLPDLNMQKRDLYSIDKRYMRFGDLFYSNIFFSSFESSLIVNSLEITNLTVFYYSPILYWTIFGLDLLFI